MQLPNAISKLDVNHPSLCNLVGHHLLHKCLNHSEWQLSSYMKNIFQYQLFAANSWHTMNLIRLQKKRELYKWSDIFEWIKRNYLWLLSVLFILISILILSVSQRGKDWYVYSKFGTNPGLLHMSSETEPPSNLHTDLLWRRVWGDKPY